MAEIKAKKVEVGSFEHVNPSFEHLLAKYILLRNRLAVCEERLKSNAGVGKATVAFCWDKLEEIHAALSPGKWRPRKIRLAWILLHAVDEEMIMLMEADELAAEGYAILSEIKASPMPSNVQADWMVAVKDILTKAQEAKSDDQRRVSEMRRIMKSARNALNTYMDDAFWDIWIKQFFAFVYCVMLLAGLGLLFIFCHDGKSAPGCGLVLLLGAVGGLASGLISGEPQHIAKGHFYKAAIYNSLVRPVLGALAAVLMFWMIQAHYLVSIQPRHVQPPSQGAGEQSNSGAKAAQVALQGGVQQEESQVQDKQDKQEPGKEDETDTIIVFTTEPEKKGYMYFILLFVAGFSGDKLLKFISDKATSRLFSAAEKTKEPDA